MVTGFLLVAYPSFELCADCAASTTPFLSMLVGLVLFLAGLSVAASFYILQDDVKWSEVGN